MISQILVPLDGSPLAETALPYAEQLALGLKVELRLLRVVEPIRGEAKILPGIVKGEDDEQARRSVEAYMTELEKRLSALGKSLIAEHTAGVPEVEIIAVAKETPGTLTVMSTHGRSGITRWMLGSVAAKVLHFGSGPVLLIRPTAPGTAAADTSLQHLVIPLDGSPQAEQVLAEAGPIARALKLDVLLLRATPGLAEYARWSAGDMVMPDYSKLMEDVDKEAEGYLAATATTFKQAHELEAVQTLRVHGDAAQGILDAAKAAGTLVAMTTHGRTGFRRALLGSVADRVVRHGNVPVLLVRSAPEA